MKPSSPTHVLEQLRQALISGELAPSTWLREENLARRYGVSRTPIREACSRLTQEGLLQQVPRRGFRVSRLDMTELEEVYPVLVALEMLSLQCINESLDPLVTELRTMNFSDGSPALDASAFYSIDVAWHSRLVAACRNSVLIKMHRSLSQRMARFIHAYWRRPVDLDRSRSEHAMICQALSRDDIELAGALLRAHRQQGFERICVLMRDSASGGDN